MAVEHYVLGGIDSCSFKYLFNPDSAEELEKKGLIYSYRTDLPNPIFEYKVEGYYNSKLIIKMQRDRPIVQEVLIDARPFDVDDIGSLVENVFNVELIHKNRSYTPPEEQKLFPEYDFALAS